MQVAEANGSIFDIYLIDLAPRASGESPTERSLKVTELDDGDRSVRVSLEMARLIDDTLHQ